MDGFLLDRGFQVLLTAYPEARKTLNYQELQLQNFARGAHVRIEGRWQTVTDPFESPFKILQTLQTSIGTLRDKIRIVQFRNKVCSGTIEELFQQPESSTYEHLQKLNFSPFMIERFFRPFFGGVFMDPAMDTSNHLAEFLFRMFAIGNTCLPSSGMGAIAEQVAASLQQNIRTKAHVKSLTGTTAVLNSGESLTGKAIVVATDGAMANVFLPDLPIPQYRSVTCLYYSATEPPMTGPYLILNGGSPDLINHLCVVSQIAPTYAPADQQLIAVSVLSDSDPTNLENRVRKELEELFGSQIQSWKHLKTYRISTAQPKQVPPLRNPFISSPQIREGLFICGDYCSTGTINGALYSGRQAAEAVMQAMGA